MDMSYAKKARYEELKPRIYETIQYLNEHPKLGQTSILLDWEELSTIYFALDRAHPQRPDEWSMNGYERRVCPNCGAGDSINAPYCKWCGQAIDWSDDYAE